MVQTNLAPARSPETPLSTALCLFESIVAQNQRSGVRGPVLQNLIPVTY